MVLKGSSMSDKGVKPPVAKGRIYENISTTAPEVPLISVVEAKISA